MESRTTTVCGAVAVGGSRNICEVGGTGTGSPGKAFEAAALVLGMASPGPAINIEVPNSGKKDLEGTEHTTLSLVLLGEGRLCGREAQHSPPALHGFALHGFPQEEALDPCGGLGHAGSSLLYPVSVGSSSW